MVQKPASKHCGKKKAGSGSVRWRKGLCCSLQPGSESATSWSLQSSPGPAHPTARNIPSAPTLPQQPHPGQAGSAPRLAAGSVRLQRAFTPPGGETWRDFRFTGWVCLFSPHAPKRNKIPFWYQGPSISGFLTATHCYSFPEVDCAYHRCITFLCLGYPWGCYGVLIG